jgi:hypothetical protein
MPGSSRKSESCVGKARLVRTNIGPNLDRLNGFSPIYNQRFISHFVDACYVDLSAITSWIDRAVLLHSLR